MTDAAADRELVAAFLAGREESAFRRLYAAYAPRLYLALVRLSGGRESEAEEALQETWIRAAAGLAGFRWESALSTWLHGIAVNAWREIARARRRDRPLEDAESLFNGADADAGGRVDLERALRMLPDGYREVLLLHDVYGYTHEEVAVRLAIAPGTSKSQLARARESLRRRLGAGTRQREREMTR